GAEQRSRMLGMLQRLNPDCILAEISPHGWKGLSRSRNGETDLCILSSDKPVQLRQQIDYLCAYASLKAEFRQCKHLLGIAELRSQWLVDYAREAVAYVGNGRHLHANVAYLSLFGFQTEAEALGTEVLHLVQQDERTIFTPLTLEAEQGAVPSNRFLMTLQTAQGKAFRAEIRFIPSVYHGRRCLQLHVHPLLRAEELAELSVQAQAPVARADDPWGKPAERHPPQNASRQKHPQTGQKTTTSTELVSGQRLQAYYQELLNLRGHQHAAILAAAPRLQYNPQLRLDYAQLLANAHDDRSRFRLDLWILRHALQHLQQQRAYPVQQQIWLTPGSWLFTNREYRQQWLNVLRQQRRLTPQLIVGLDLKLCIQARPLVLKLLPVLQGLGIRLALDNVREDRAELAALLEVSAIKLIRTHGHHARQLAAEQELPLELQQLLQNMQAREVAVIINGVQDIQSLNRLCETTAAYLQGPILDKFSR
ncbi:MAG: EAL domain-containing protein, partial [Thiolinea sp.]